MKKESKSDKKNDTTFFGVPMNEAISFDRDRFSITGVDPYEEEVTLPTQSFLEEVPSWAKTIDEEPESDHTLTFTLPARSTVHEEVTMELSYDGDSGYITIQDQALKDKSYAARLRISPADLCRLNDYVLNHR